MLMINRCSKCYYYDFCNGSSLCDDYIPLGDEAEDLAIEEFIEDDKAEFRIEWNQYISTFNN